MSLKCLACQSPRPDGDPCGPCAAGDCRNCDSQGSKYRVETAWSHEGDGAEITGIALTDGVRQLVRLAPAGKGLWTLTFYPEPVPALEFELFSRKRITVEWA